MTMSSAEQNPGATVIAVTSGKGGIGKTNLVVNLAVALARLGHRVGVLDADFGLGNVDVLLGLTPSAHVGHVIAGEKSLNDVILQGPLGIRIIPASSGLQSLTALTAAQRGRLTAALDVLRRELDFLLIDTASGISDNVMEMLNLAGRVVVLTSLEPCAVVDAYATVKVLSAQAPDKEIGIVVNEVRDGDEAALAFKQLDTAAHRFLGRNLRYYGFIAADPAVRESVVVQRAIVDHLPQAPASRCFRILASRMAGLGPASGGLRLATRDGSQAEAAEVSRCA
jgi:flagellar biosynthesis protein FlhG